MSDDNAPLHVHGDSLRVGIRLACLRFTNRIPAEDQVRGISDMRPAHVIVNEFPLNVISKLVQDRQERRRTLARDAMQIMLHKGPEAALLTLEEIDRISTKAWQIAAAMETQENVSASLDSMDPSKSKAE